MRTKAEVMKEMSRVLSEKIIIQKRVLDEDPIGNETELWSDWKTLWAEKNGLWGKEYYAAKVVGEEKTVKFTVRFNNDLKQLNAIDYRLLFDGGIYDIKNLDPIKNKGNWLIIKALERDING